MNYLITDNKGNKLIGNIFGNCRICCDSCAEETEIVNCMTNGKKHRRGKFLADTYVIFICSDKDVKSAKVFKKLKLFYIDLMPYLQGMKSELDEVSYKRQRRFFHNIVTHAAHALQNLYTIIPQEELNGDTKGVIQRINSTLIAIEGNRIPQSFLKMMKSINLINTECSIFNKLYEANPSMDFQYHSIHRVLLLVLNCFWLDFLEKNININIDNSVSQLRFDYETISAALCQVIDNICKYISPGSKLLIKFKKETSNLKIVFDMISLKITPQEKDLLITEGYYGIYANKADLHGKGIGLFVANKLLRMNDAKIDFKINVKPTLIEYKRGFPFENNVIEIIFQV